MLNKHSRLLSVTSVVSSVIALSTLLSGCSLFQNNTDNYLEAKEMPPIVVPEGKDTDALGQIYPVPATDQVITSNEFVVPRPQPVSANVFEETVKIQSFGGEKWILINQPPEEIWPRVRNILNRSGITAERVDASKGILETSWVQFKNDDATSHRFRFSIEPAIQLNSTEVKILQMETAKGSEDSSKPWPVQSESPSREQEMVEIISNALAADISGPSVSLLAQSIGGAEKVKLVTPKTADPYIEISLSYERARASVVYSLSRGGFSIEDNNEPNGPISVSYKPESLDAEEEPGFFSRWFSFGDKGETDTHHYVVKVEQAGNTVQVRLVDTEGGSLDAALSSTLLKIIRGNLS